MEPEVQTQNNYLRKDNSDGLLPDSEIGNQGSVLLHVFSFNVVQQTSSLTNKL